MQIFLIPLLWACLYVTPRSKAPGKPPKIYIFKRFYSRYLLEVCQDYKIEKHFNILRGMINVESKGKWWKIEKTKYGREISFGLKQISIPSLKLYAKAKGIKIRNHKKWLLKWRNNIDCGVWTFAWYLKIYGGNYRKALSAHNMGMRGFREWRKRNGRSYYHIYVHRVEREYRKVLRYK